MADSMNEHVIEWIRGDEKATVTAPSTTKLKGQVVRLAEKYPDEVDYIENKDGSICGHVPVKWVNIRHPRTMSEEQKEAARARLMNLRSESKVENVDEAYSN